MPDELLFLFVPSLTFYSLSDVFIWGLTNRGQKLIRKLVQVTIGVFKVKLFDFIQVFKMNQSLLLLKVELAKFVLL